jgi:preprotein translocase subunit SecE
MGKREDIKDFGIGCLSMVLGLWVILYVVDWLLTILLESL